MTRSDKWQLAIVLTMWAVAFAVIFFVAASVANAQGYGRRADDKMIDEIAQWAMKKHGKQPDQPKKPEPKKPDARPPIIEPKQASPAPRISEPVGYPLNPAAIQLQLPSTNDGFLTDVLASPDTIFYRLPQVYQHYNDSRLTSHKPGAETFYGVFSTDFLKDMNANQDFPWETTVGLNSAHRSKSNPYGAINFVKLPHTLFALPFALLGVLAASLVTPVTWRTVALVSSGMAS